jgi:hypothetical protein
VTAWIRFAVALLAALLFLVGPVMPASWVWVQMLNHTACHDFGPTPLQGESYSTEWYPPLVTCTYVFPQRIVVVRHKAPYRDVAAALMAMGVVLAIAAYAAPGRKPDELTAAHG